MGALRAIRKRGKRTWRWLLGRARTLLGARRLWVPPGHFYSPIPSARDVEALERRSAGADPLEGIELDEAGMLELLERLEPLYADFPFGRERRDGLRFQLANGFFSDGDAVFLYCLLRWLRPKRFVEVGSGYSSALVCDVNERCLGGALELTCIEPFPRRLRRQLAGADVRLLESRVQDLSPREFECLAAGDVLFIDSSHVGRLGSDVNYLFFRVLPALPVGVWVHLHDVLFPFEYPVAWAREGRAWNEAYLLRAFLTHNPRYRIRLWSDYLASHHRALLRRAFPLALGSSGGAGGSIWLERVS